MAEGGGGFAEGSTGGVHAEEMGIEDAASADGADGGWEQRCLLPAVGEGSRVQQLYSPKRDHPGRAEAGRSEEDGDSRRGGHGLCRWQPGQAVKRSTMSSPDVQDRGKVTGESNQRTALSVSSSSSPSRTSLRYVEDPGAKYPSFAMLSSRSFSNGKGAGKSVCDRGVGSPTSTTFLPPGKSRQERRGQEHGRVANHSMERPATGISRSSAAGNLFNVTGDEVVDEGGTACSRVHDSGGGDDTRGPRRRDVPGKGGLEIEAGESNECPGACRAEDLPAEEDLLEALARELDGDPCGAPDELEQQQASDESLARALQEEEWRGVGKPGEMAMVCPLLSTESRWNSPQRLPGLDAIGRGARRRRGEGLPGSGRSFSVMVSGEGARDEKGMPCDNALGPGEGACDTEEPSWGTVLTGLGKARHGAISVSGEHGPGGRAPPEEGPSPGRDEATTAHGRAGTASPGTVLRCLGRPDLKAPGDAFPDVPCPSASGRSKGWMRCGSLKARASSDGLLLRRNDSDGGGGAGRGCRRKRGESESGGASAANRVDGGGVGGFSMDELPDEVLGKVARFTHLPRGVSTRFERMRVQVVRERIIGALESSAKLPEEKAEAVETAIFELSGRYPSKAYKAKAREISFNLRVGKNDPLRERVLSGSLSPAVLVRMSSDELAPLAVRRERERIAKKRFSQVTSRRDDPLHTVTERFSCPECAHGLTQYRTWRRKAVVDRYRVIVQCLQCRHTWEL